MSKFDEITRRFGEVPFMKREQAEVLRRIVEAEDAAAILEIGFFKGKSSAYLAAILEDRGRGRLVTVDRAGARQRKPNIAEILRAAGLAHRVEPIFAARSFTWELQRLIAATPRPVFDLCYFDGGHTWDDTGFGILLVDMLLRPGGVIVLDDMDWSVAGSAYYRGNPAKAAKFSPDEAAAPTVRRAWELILPHLGYAREREIPAMGWGVARKPG